MKKGKVTMKNHKQNYSVVYITHSERGYYVGQTGDALNRYSAHKAQGREVLADFPAPDIPFVRVELERALLQFCEGVGLPLENRWYADAIYYIDELEEGAY